MAKNKGFDKLSSKLVSKQSVAAAKNSKGKIPDLNPKKNNADAIKRRFKAKS